MIALFVIWADSLLERSRDRFLNAWGHLRSFAVLCVGMLMIHARRHHDNVALPSIQSDLVAGCLIIACTIAATALESPTSEPDVAGAKRTAAVLQRNWHVLDRI